MGRPKHEGMVASRSENVANHKCMDIYNIDLDRAILGKQPEEEISRHFAPGTCKRILHLCVSAPPMRILLVFFYHVM